MLPITVTLPSRRRVTLRVGGEGRPEPLTPSLFSDVLALFARGELSLTSNGDAVDVMELDLADFHVIRALVIKAGLLPEEEVELECHNCKTKLAVKPCAGLEIGPYRDDELDDPELDSLLEVGPAHPITIPPISIGRVRVAREIVLERRTVREALPLLVALAKDPVRFSADEVRSMGIMALGSVTDPAKIARILEDCDDDAFNAISEVFLATYYPLRLASDVFCTECKARSTVDAPLDRELEGGPAPPSAPRDDASSLPPLEEFVEIAHAMAEPLLAALPAVGDEVELIVDGDTPAVDDGGEPLLGAYVPPPPHDAPVPTRPPTVTLYYQTFAAIEREEGPYDWKGELRETIEHELEHHRYFLSGEDPMDEAEHAEIDREVARVVGRAESTRRTLEVMRLSVPDFFVRAWPLVAVAAVVLLITMAESTCGAR